MTEFYCKQIGIVRNSVTEGIDQDWGQVVSDIVIEKDLESGLDGIGSFSHILVVFFMHRFTWDPETDLVRRPQGRSDMPLTGIFSQRAKHRPNPIGVTGVQLLGVKENILTVRGLDAIDGTPILDIKPYFPQFDRISDPVKPAWVDELMTGYF